MGYFPDMILALNLIYFIWETTFVWRWFWRKQKAEAFRLARV